MIKYSIFLTLIFILSLSCKESKDNTQELSDALSVEQNTKSYPANLTKVFKAHGGLETWNSMETLVFTMLAEDGNSVITTDLKSRMALIETENFNIGFDGEEAWVDQDSTYFNGDPVFYYDLMFYFYAMPFVLSDDGINYSEADSLSFNGIKYPGIKITYNSGVGASPKDEYILYYHPDTNKMEWLSYTVTYFSKEKSDQFRYIKYDEWQEVEGLLFPKRMQWYAYENDSITTKQNERSFIDVSITKEKISSEQFKKPFVNE